MNKYTDIWLEQVIAVGNVYSPDMRKNHSRMLEGYFISIVGCLVNWVSGTSNLVGLFKGKVILSSNYDFK